MKKTIFFFKTILLFLIVSNVLMACGSDDDEVTSGQVVSNVSGVVYYNVEGKKWYIMHHTPGTIDEVTHYYPENMKSEFKKEELEVVFSGIVISSDAEAAQMGGLSTYRIRLTDIHEK